MIGIFCVYVIEGRYYGLIPNKREVRKCEAPPPCMGGISPASLGLLVQAKQKPSAHVRGLAVQLRWLW